MPNTIRNNRRIIRSLRDELSAIRGDILEGNFERAISYFERNLDHYIVELSVIDDSLAKVELGGCND